MIYKFYCIDYVINIIYILVLMIHLQISYVRREGEMSMKGISFKL